MSEEQKLSEVKEAKTQSPRKIQLELDGTDFQGFSLRMLGVVGVSLFLKWLTDFDGFLIFVVMTLCWLVFFIYKIYRFKEEAYHQIIDDLEEQNKVLEKSNILLQNAIRESTGMRVSTKTKSEKKSDDN